MQLVKLIQNYKEEEKALVFRISNYQTERYNQSLFG